MKRSHLKKKYLKNRSNENWKIYTKQRNFCTNLLKKTKRRFFSKLKIKNVCDNKKFWKTIKPYFSDKGTQASKWLLLENEEAVSDEKQIAQIFNKYFINITLCT